MNIVSMSVYGNNPVYTIGAVENAKLMPVIYPGWKLQIFIHDVPRPIINQLSSLGCIIADMNGQDIRGGMFWRFLPISDTNGYVICRDSDSRINMRERAAVDAWIGSGKLCHIMRDHRNHHNPQFPIFAGMWGLKGKSIDMYNLVTQWPFSGQYCDDLHFLRERIWPLVQHSVCIHDFNNPFPPHQPYYGFVGQRFDQFNKSYDN